MGQFSNSFPKHFSYLCEYAIRFDLSCSFCEYPFIFHRLHCSPSCFDPDSLLLAYLWLGLSWIDCISANKSFSSSKTSSRKPYTSSKQQERQKHSVETTINFSINFADFCLIYYEFSRKIPEIFSLLCWHRNRRDRDPVISARPRLAPISPVPARFCILNQKHFKTSGFDLKHCQFIAAYNFCSIGLVQ